VSDRAKARDLGGRTVVLKLKRSDHTLLTRRSGLAEPTRMADRIYRTARALFDAAGGGRAGPFRLIGVGLGDLVPAAAADLSGDLLDPAARRRIEAERAADAIRARFGAAAIVRGRALR
jgi:DNA polymerase-4